MFHIFTYVKELLVNYQNVGVYFLPKLFRFAEIQLVISVQPTDVGKTVSSSPSQQ